MKKIPLHSRKTSPATLSLEALKITDLIDLSELQRMQDVFLDALGVASLITDPQGNPITQPSNFCILCTLIRSTPAGNANCIHSDALIGANSPSGPLMRPCLSGGLFDGGASITLGNRHIANWLIGQVRDPDMNLEHIISYTCKLGIDETTARQALDLVPQMNQERFAKVCKSLFMFANQISTLAYQNLALRQNECNLRATLDSIGDAFLATSSQGIITRINPTAVSLTGWSKEEALGTPLHEILHLIATNPLQQQDLLSTLSGNNTRRQQFDCLLLVDRKGNEFHVSLSTAPLFSPEQDIAGFVLVIRDISAHIHLEEQLHQSQKMEAIGQLAGGVAHDFNNMLSGVLGAAELLSLNPAYGPEHENSKLIRLIIDAAEKAASLTRKLLDFSRKGRRENAPQEMHRLITSVIAILERSIDRKINLITRLEATERIIIGDASQLQNALLNLCLNSRDAMPTGGILTLSTRNIFLDETACSALAEDISPGHYLELVVHDTGVGIAKKDLSRLFEPFFTTKEPGKGTGLGLAAVYVMIKEHKGAIQVCSEPGHGTRFTLYLPVQEGARCPENAHEPLDLPRPGLRILLIDDEPIVRSIARLILQQQGCLVVCAENGTEALDLLRNGTRFDLIFLDIIMPGMNGRETYTAIRALPCPTPIVFASGFAYNHNITDLLDGVIGFIEKPYKTETLIRILSAIP